MLIEEIDEKVSQTIDNARDNVTATKAFEDDRGNKFHSKPEAVVSNLSHQLSAIWDNSSFRHTEYLEGVDTDQLVHLFTLGKIAEQILRQEEIIETNKG